MNEQQFLERIARRSGVTDLREAELIAWGVLQSLGEHLTRREAEAVAQELPPGLAPALTQVTHGGSFDLYELQTRVAQRTGARRGVALEQLAVVGMTVAEAVRADVLDPIRRDLPAAVRVLLCPPRSFGPPPARRDPSRRTLADGEPGGTRPLYRARPDSAHSESVARSDNPHAETKLSSARGLTQEREQRTLAEGGDAPHA
jgi:uncharacterized protein (DUF2267 family)